MALIDNIVSYWSFDSSNSNDSVGSNNGTDTNVVYSAGKISNAWVGDNTSYSAITDAASLKPAGKYSINFWMKTTTTDLDTLFCSQNYLAGPDRFYGFSALLNGSGGIYFTHAFGTATNNALSSVSTSLNDNTYHMVTMIYDQAKMYIYVDGGSDTNQNMTSNATYDTNNYPYIGARFLDGIGAIDTKYTGAVDEIGFWSRDLSSAEVTSLYNGGAGFAYPFSSGGVVSHNLILVGAGA